MRGLGRSIRRTLSSWYLDKDDNALSYQLLKYQSRNGWTHKDVIRLCHVKDNRSSIRWALELPLDARSITIDGKGKDYPSTDRLPSRLEKYTTLHKTDSKREVIDLIESERFTHEMIPNNWKNDPDIWVALLKEMPVNATLRNLGKLASLGLLKPFSDSLDTIKGRFNAESLSYSKIHPLAIFLAAYIYRKGEGHKGNLTWTPNDQVRSILEEAFYTSFSNVKPSGKNIMLGVDVSGSMWHNYKFHNLSLADITAAIALITVRTEPNTYCVGFSNEVQQISIGKNDSLSDIMNKMAGMGKWGGTDCAAPLEYAMKQKINNVDLFVTYTDNETWCGGIHPAKSLEHYRMKSGNDTGHIVVGMAANDFTIADPKDPKSLDICGFDAAIPGLISEFAREL